MKITLHLILLYADDDLMSDTDNSSFTDYESDDDLISVTDTSSFTDSQSDDGNFCLSNVTMLS